MKHSWTSIFASYKTSLILLMVYAIGLAAATFIEKYAGTATAKMWVYYSPLFILLQFGMVLNFLFLARKHQLFRQKKWGMPVVHFAFIIILAGAFYSHLFSEEGLMHIREGESTDRIAVQTTRKTYFHTLPFEVELVRFTLTRYPGSASPSSFESRVLIHRNGKTTEELISMNNTLDLDGYRFFQASYDTDEKGTVLSVNRDVVGRNITYTGYALLLIGFLLTLFGPRSRFRHLSRALASMRAAGLMLCLAFALLPLSGRAQESAGMMKLGEALQQFAVDPRHAAAFGALPIQSENGRMIPMNTFSSEVLRKLHKKDHFSKLNSDQFLLSLLALPDMWMRVPLISYSSKEIASRYDLPQKACSYVQLFEPSGAYKLQEGVEEAYNKMPNERTRFDKDLIKLDEQANILHLLLSAQLIKIFPKEDDPTHRWYAPGEDLSVYTGQDYAFVTKIFVWYMNEVQAALKSHDWKKADEVLAMIGKYQQAKCKVLDIGPKKMQAEITYNRMDIFRLCKIGYLIFGGLLLVATFATLFRARPLWRYLTRLLAVAATVVFLFHTYGMGVRWYIAGYAPWSNSYETMVYVAWATVAGGLLFFRRSAITMALATLFGGVILFVSGLSWMDPQISPLVPVLKSPWLMFHVAVIVLAYGFFGICCLLGITNLVIFSSTNEKNRIELEQRVRELTLVNEMSLLIGLALMTVGTFLGAIWANESWGRYWGWDPKETWALITVVVYALVEHLRLVRRWYSIWRFNFLSVLAFSSVLMTFFGVNYFLSGMHSYGENDQVGAIFAYLLLALVVVLLLGIVSYRKWRRWDTKTAVEKQ